VIRAIGYIRVSTEEQGRSGHSLDMQPERIRQWCALYDIHLIDVITDSGVSAGVALHKRPGGKQLLARIRAGEADAVVIYRLDRLFRNAQHGLNVIRDELDMRGVALQSITEKIDTTSPAGRLMLTMMLGIGEYERDVIRERTRATSEDLRRRGRVYGHTPYGCVSHGGVWDEGQGKLIGQSLYRCPKTWPHRELIVSLRGPHDGDAQLSLGAIVNELDQRGIPAPGGGKRWTKTGVSRVINSHGGIKHIPALPTPHEAAVSEAASHG
jgi:site-specific DNA recombinase